MPSLSILFPAWISSGPRYRTRHGRFSTGFTPATIRLAYGCRTLSARARSIKTGSFPGIFRVISLTLQDLGRGSKPSDRPTSGRIGPYTPAHSVPGPPQIQRPHGPHTAFAGSPATARPGDRGE